MKALPNTAAAIVLTVLLAVGVGLLSNDYYLRI